jgi:acetyl esterase/lipase
MRRLLVLLPLFICGLAHAQYGVAEFHNIVYTQASGFPQLLDLYIPTPFARKARPGIIFVHGGGWAGGSKDDFAAWARYYTAQGYVCTSVNYRLTPLHVWPAQINDVQAAVRWMRRNSRTLALDPNRIGAVGASAGGHLVLFLGETDTLNDFDPSLSGFSSRVQAVVDFFGPTEFNMPSEWSGQIWTLIQNLIGQPWTPASPAYAAAGPVNYVTPDDAPTVVFHGLVDTVVPIDQSRRIVARLQASQIPVTYHEFPGEGHGFTGPTTNFCISVMNNFFLQRLGPL